MASSSVTLPGGPVVVELSKWGRIYGTVSRGSDLVSGIDVTVLSKSKELEWTATTDNDGNYSVDILHTGVYAVAIGSSSGLSLASKEVAISAAQNSVACNFDLDISVVSGMVYQPDGVTPMSNAVVSLAFQNEAVGRQTTDDGSYSFLVHTPGVFTVTAMGADGLAPPLTNIVVGTNVVVDGQNLTAGSNTVYCTVTDTVGAPIEDAVVYLSSLADSTSNVLYLVYRTVANGTCTFNGMADGVYMARISGAGYALAEHEITLPGSGFETFAMETGRVIEGQVTSAESGGAPVSDVLVSVGNLRFGEVAVVLTDADGSYAFDSLPRGVLDVVATRLGTFEADIYTNANTDALAVQTIDLQVNSRTDAEITGTITNEVGTPVSGVVVKLVNEAGTPIAMASSDYLGNYSLRGWPSGEFTLEASARGYLAGRAALVVTSGVAITEQDLLLTGPVTGGSPDTNIHALGKLFYAMQSKGVGDYVPDFVTYDFWRDVLSGDYGLPPPAYYNNQLGGDRLVDRWWKYYFGLDKKVRMYCYKVDAARRKCTAAEDAVHRTHAKFVEDWDILKDVNQANVMVVGSQNAMLAAKLTKFAATIATLRGYDPKAGTTMMTVGTIEDISAVTGDIFNYIGLAKSALLQGDFKDWGSYLSSMDLVMSELKEIWKKDSGKIAGLDKLGAITEGLAILNDIKTLYDDYQNLEDDAQQRFQQYTDDVNAYVDAIKNLHRCYYDLRAAVHLCENPEDEDPIDDDPPPPDNEEGDEDEDGDDSDEPWEPDDGGWNPPPTPGGTPSAPYPPGGGGNSGSSGSTSVLGSIDPNDKLTVGFGPLGFIGTDTLLHYTIRFENRTNATLAAFRVTVSDTLSTDLDWSTFEFEEIHFNHVTVKPPSGLQIYHNDGVKVATDPNPVEIQSSLNPDTGRVEWRMESVDLVTGGLPEDPFSGFLPPNTNAPIGEGYVKFAIKPRSDAWDSMLLTNTASIVFDYNEAIPTPPVTNIIDNTPPISQVFALDEIVPRTFTVNWTGSDGAGAGVVSYDVYVSRENMPYVLWVAGTTNSRALFHGEPGVGYGFVCVAKDGVGLTESLPYVADTETRTEFWMTQIEPLAGTGDLYLEWESATGMVYQLMSGNDLLSTLQTNDSNIAATPPLNTYTTRVDEVSGFYKIRIEP